MTNNFYCLKTESKSYTLMEKHTQGSIFVSTESKLALTNLFLYSTVRLMRNWNTGKINTWYRLVNHAGLALGMILLLIQYAYKRCSKLKHKVIAKYTFFILFDTQLYPWYGYQNKNMVLIATPKRSISAQSWQISQLLGIENPLGKIDLVELRSSKLIESHEDKMYADCWRYRPHWHEQRLMHHCWDIHEKQALCDRQQDHHHGQSSVEDLAER